MIVFYFLVILLFERRPLRVRKLILSFGSSQKKVSKEKIKSGVLAFARANARIRPTVYPESLRDYFTAPEVVKRPVAADLRPIWPRGINR
jgi:hypothetical protein